MSAIRNRVFAVLLMTTACGCRNRVRFTPDDIEIIGITTHDLLASGKLWAAWGTTVTNGVLALAPQTMGGLSAGMCANAIVDERPEVARYLREHSIQWRNETFNVGDVTSRVSHLVVLPDKRLHDAYWAFGDIDVVASRFPAVKGFVRLYAPEYLEHDHVFLCMDCGPSPHGATAYYELVKSNSVWTIVWSRCLHDK